MTGRSVAGAGSGGRLCFASLPPRRRSTVAGSRPGALCSPRPPLPEGEEATRPRAGGARDLTPAQAKAITHPPARGEARDDARSGHRSRFHPPARGGGRGSRSAHKHRLAHTRPRAGGGASSLTTLEAPYDAPARARGSARSHRCGDARGHRTRPRAGKRDVSQAPPLAPSPHPPARGEARNTTTPTTTTTHAPARARGSATLRQGRAAITFRTRPRAGEAPLAPSHPRRGAATRPRAGGGGGHGIRRGAHIHELAPPRARGGPAPLSSYMPPRMRTPPRAGGANKLRVCRTDPKAHPPRARGGATSGSVATVAAFRLTQVGGRLTRFHGGR